MIHPERIEALNHRPVRRGRYVLYWMQASQRARCNHALEFAIDQANALQLPLLAVFGLTDSYPEANERHYAFMLEGLAETQTDLRRRGVQLVIRQQSPQRAATDLAGEAAMVVTDCGYTRLQKAWRRNVGSKVNCRAVQVESDVIVPAAVTSPKAEYAAATLRPKITRHLDEYLRRLRRRKLQRDSLDIRADGISLADIDAVLADMDLDRSAKRVSGFHGGASQARKWLSGFLNAKLIDYASTRNDPSLDIQSHQSPYLHFGQVSPLEIALKIRAAKQASVEARDAYLEELIVRRELSINFIHYTPRYASFTALPSWARATLGAHRSDRRPYVYRRIDLERAETHDPYWNAAMREMLLTGKMHNYMRMYWGKKIIEWTRSPRWAYRLMLTLNNKYFLDGRDPNSWASVGWCFGLHDRPWGERAIFGKVRYMNARGLERKFDIAAYVDKVNRLGSPTGE